HPCRRFAGLWTDGCLDTTHLTATQEDATWAFSIYDSRIPFGMNKAGSKKKLCIEVDGAGFQQSE
ncbi:MAG TPA: hypothetical protein VE871_16240, partial [Longimicrobium sp.]|nr:hypothetical protein [Longimicrobium sp.]